MKYTPVPIPDEASSTIAIAISRTSPVGQFAEGRSRFAAFDLGPHPSHVRAISIVPEDSGLVAGTSNCSDLQNLGIRAQRYFAPVVMFLDSDKNPISSQGLRGEVRAYGQNVSLHFPVPGNAQFLVIYTDPKMIGFQYKLEPGHQTTVLPVPGYAAFLPTSVAIRINGRGASTGVLSLHLHQDR